MDMEKVVANLVHKVERRFYGKYRGFVVDNDDPEQLGRLRLRVPSVLGPNVVTGWALPCVPYGGHGNQGFLCIPERDAGVWVEFEEGDLEFPIWVGTFWSKPGGNSELPKPNNADGSEHGSVQRPPTRKILKTQKGHTIQFEDADGEERIIICDGQRENRIVFSNSGVSIEYKANVIAMSDQGITVHNATSDPATKASNKILIEDVHGNTITMDGSSGGIPGTRGITINGEKKVCLEGLITWLMSHTHIGNLGVPCPLNPVDVAKLITVQALPDGDILSQGIKLG